MARPGARELCSSRRGIPVRINMRDRVSGRLESCVGGQVWYERICSSRRGIPVGFYMREWYGEAPLPVKRQ